jgi:hypothetical protein
MQEAIGLLVTCHKFEIEGAAATIRKMLPLTFSREQGAVSPSSLPCQKLFAAVQDVFAVDTLEHASVAMDSSPTSARDAHSTSLCIVSLAWTECAQLHSCFGCSGEGRCGGCR